MLYHRLEFEEIMFANLTWRGLNEITRRELLFLNFVTCHDAQYFPHLLKIPVISSKAQNSKVNWDYIT